MYLLLTSDAGISILNTISPNFINDELELWTKEGNNLLKELALFYSKESKRFATNKEALSNYIDVGSEN